MQISWESSRIVFGTHILYSFSGNTLTMNSSPAPHLANLLISASEDVILEGLSSLQRQTCEGSMNWC